MRVDGLLQGESGSSHLISLSSKSWSKEIMLVIGKGIIEAVHEHWSIHRCIAGLIQHAQITFEYDRFQHLEVWNSHLSTSKISQLFWWLDYRSWRSIPGWWLEQVTMKGRRGLDGELLFNRGHSWILDVVQAQVLHVSRMLSTRPLRLTWSGRRLRWSML